MTAMPDPNLRGRFVWHELMTTDTKSAADFFTKVVGWKTQAWANDPAYTMFVAKGRPMAGLMVIPEEAKKMGTPPNWLTYIGTPDVDGTARQATSLGAKILRQPSDIPKVGRFAVIQDPQGAVFAAFTPAQDASSDASPVVGDFSWHELVTTDWPAAFSFYQRLFGWEKTNAMDMGPEMGTYQMYGRGGKTLGGMLNQPKQRQGPPSWLPYIRVADSKNAAARVKKLGGQLVSGPMEVPGGDWIAQGLDLQGALFAVHSLKPAAASKPARAKAASRRPTSRRAAKKTGPARGRTPARRPKGKKRSAPKKRR
jgi:predicted enzyme related to lactoylglutathione lyase